VLDEDVWSPKGKVLYLVTDCESKLRLVGESLRRLKDRWRMSPMNDVATREEIGHALFHSTAWPAIERGFSSQPSYDRNPFPALEPILLLDEVRVLRGDSNVTQITGGRVSAYVRFVKRRMTAVGRQRQFDPLTSRHTVDT
jgi:hypothetical protein